MSLSNQTPAKALLSITHMSMVMVMILMVTMQTNIISGWILRAKHIRSFRQRVDFANTYLIILQLLIGPLSDNKLASVS